MLRIYTDIQQDLSYPSGTILLSNATPREHQGIAASLMNTVVNYSISIGLGIAGTVESRINRTGDKTLEGYRSAYYVGIGLAGLGCCVSVLFVLATHFRSKSNAGKDQDSEKTE